MSRIQNILEKAEREGAMRRVRPDAAAVTAPEPPTGAPAPVGVATTPPAAQPGGGFELPLPGIPGAPLPSPAAPLTSAPITSAPITGAQGLTPARIVAGAQLDARLITAASTDAAVAEQYRALRTRILHADPMSPVNVVMITSPGRGEGKTLTAGNLGLAMAQEWQRRICIVDADLRRPQMHRIFGLPDGPGLCDVLTGRATLEEALVVLEEHQVTILPAGNVPAHPAELLGTTAMRRMMDTLRSQFDRIVVDTAPAMPLADVSILAPLVDRVLLVIRAGVTTKPSIHEAVNSIDGSRLLGFVLNEAAV